ncbi:hypothetical protein RMCBS344292_13587 [Rhizopus microsporus]|nr:hypothetical protein RMCBS344292_13587 [Rhizopus microsporus]
METQPGISLKTRPYFTDCIHWNDNGQLSVCLDNGVHIVTPVLTGVSSKYENYAHAGLTLPPFPSDKDVGTEPFTPEEIETSYFNEEGFRCATWSPSGMSPSQSCLLTVVTTKHRVLTYQSSTKNPLNSDWQLVSLRKILNIAVSQLI